MDEWRDGSDRSMPTLAGASLAAAAAGALIGVKEAEGPAPLDLGALAPLRLARFFVLLRVPAWSAARRLRWVLGRVWKGLVYQFTQIKRIPMEGCELTSPPPRHSLRYSWT